MVVMPGNIRDQKGGGAMSDLTLQLKELTFLWYSTYLHECYREMMAPTGIAVGIMHLEDKLSSPVS